MSQAVDKKMLVDSITKMIGVYNKEIKEHAEAEILMLYVEGQRDVLDRLLTAIERGKYDLDASGVIDGKESIEGNENLKSNAESIVSILQEIGG